MAWTNNGIVWYGGEKPINRTPQLQTTAEQLAQANPGRFQPTIKPAYDPRTAQQLRNSRDQIAVEIARRAGTPITLNASGDVVEAVAPVEDERLTRALQGRTPRDAEDLNAWLKESGISSEAQRMALAMGYGPLPSRPAEGATKQHTLGSLGLRKASKLTQAQFAERLRFHGVPQADHLRLAMEAFQGGHIVPDDENQGMTFHPGSTLARTPEDQAYQKKLDDLKASVARLDAHRSRTRAVGGVRVGDLKASARDWEC